MRCTFVKRCAMGLTRLGKLERLETKRPVDRTETQLLELDGAIVIVQTVNLALDLVEANVVESGVGRLDGLLLGHQKTLLPPHVNVVQLVKVLMHVVRVHGLFLNVSPGREPTPVGQVCFFLGSPLGSAGVEGVLGPDYFSLKVCGEVCICSVQTLDPEVATQKVVGHVHVLDFHVDRMLLALGHLGAHKLRSCSEVRRHDTGDDSLGEKRCVVIAVVGAHDGGIFVCVLVRVRRCCRCCRR